MISPSLLLSLPSLFFLFSLSSIASLFCLSLLSLLFLSPLFFPISPLSLLSLSLSPSISLFLSPLIFSSPLSLSSLHTPTFSLPSNSHFLSPTLILTCLLPISIFSSPLSFLFRLYRPPLYLSFFLSHSHFF